ncbi:hypothetical protein HPB49_005773 [Dermacentor silvarum]|uniref:Uncharacterized protein n=1 Tax=Dermacentor silvarum TaxID=543639 RepID=A0ACB8DVS2_DERSI|nr:hypothetical protein HPB49_005773 [Dermacentor silvarum]
MTHVLVKWITEESWDVYPIRAIVDAQLGFRLMTEENYIDQVRGNIVAIKWIADSPPAEAELLDFGVLKSMEKKRTQLVKAALQRRGDQPLGLEMTKRKTPLPCSNEQKKLVRKLENLTEAPKVTQVVQAEQMDIGGGVLVEKTVLNRLHAHCNGLPTKFARNLLRHVFGDEELRGKSLYGKGSNSNKDGPLKKVLDPLRLNAVIGM